MFNSDRLQLICWKVVMTIVDTIIILSLCQKNNCIDNDSKSYLSRLFWFVFNLTAKGLWPRYLNLLRGSVLSLCQS